jgi:hypothetical protein
MGLLVGLPFRDIGRQSAGPRRTRTALALSKVDPAEKRLRTVHGWLRVIGVQRLVSASAPAAALL